ncbi:DUF3126 domain-containing protein [Bradyrhizobium sp. MOS003]|nr:DUF3126 domain-containing protein [Bradyrhizobium sp. MOS003]
MTAAEKGKLEAYLKKTLSSELSVRTRANTKGSLEVYKGEEFVGVIFADVEDGEKSFMFSVAILKEDL